MHRWLRLLGLISFWSYLASLVVLGLFGLLAPGLELGTLYDLRLDSLDPEAQATLLHQYRFLKVFVLGIAAFAWIFRRQIFEQTLYKGLFLAVLFGAAGARLLSLLADGEPHRLLISFTASEFVFGILIAFGLRTGGQTDLSERTES